MRNTKFDKLVIEQGGIEEFVGRLNELLKEKSLQQIAKEFGIGRSTISAGLTDNNFKYDKGTNTYVKVSTDFATLDPDIYRLFVTGDFTKTVTFRGEKEVIADFENLWKERFMGIPLAKLYTLAIKEFTEKYK